MNGQNSNTTSQEDDDDEAKQIQNVLHLMKARAAGRATDEQVEEAVQQMLGQHASAAEAPSSSSSNVPLRPHQKTVEADSDDYDEEETHKEGTAEKQTSTVSSSDQKQAAASSLPRKRKRKNNSSLAPLNFALYADIPLGKQGAQMLRTFGDGPTPVVETVRAVLQGARRMTQVAIQDARHLRRQRRKAYAQAQAGQKVAVRKEKKVGTMRRLEEASPDMQYRVHTGWDPLAYKAKCGFDVEDLEQLFPEELNAYARWSDNYQAYSEKTEGPSAKKGEVDEDEMEAKSEAEVQEDKEESAVGEQKPEIDGGHLQERSAQFDIRTDVMKDDRYMEFSELRTGSFLPRISTKILENKMSEDQQKLWANVATNSVRFLHWVGFDPQSAVFPPPSDGTTHALAFLAYDFYGRIVEKAVELRVVQREKDSGKTSDDFLLLELQPGEQLSVEDIERAMNDPDIRPVPLYSGSSDAGKKAAPQLYFGPGFEHRLEMELDELMMTHGSGSSSKKKRVAEVTEEDLRIQKEEQELFARLAEPPTGGKDFFGSNDSAGQEDDSGETKRQKTSL